MRTQDAGSQKNQTTLVGSMIAMTKAAHVVMKKYENDAELIALLTDAIAIMRPATQGGLQRKKEFHRTMALCAAR